MMFFFVYLIYQHRCSFHWFAKQFYPMARTAAQSKRCKVVTYLVFWWSILNTPIGDFIFSLYTPDSLKLVCMASSVWRYFIVYNSKACITRLCKQLVGLLDLPMRFLNIVYTQILFT